MEQGQLLSAGPAAGVNAPAGSAAVDVAWVAARLAAATPGRRAAPGPSPDEARGDHELNPDLYDPARPKKAAAVLVPLVAHADTLTVLLTRRTAHLRDHAGQIAFPGGRLEDCDADAQACALRESAEEVGLDPQRVTPLGQLDVYVTRTGFEVTPVVGLVPGPVAVRPDPFEVAEVFEVPLGYFLDPASRQVHSRDWRGRTRHFYVYPYGDYYIWGATAGMLNNLAEVLVRP
jgi:8-oxo-dGTP pyrophosphatase MutT (NUDIX family)